MKSTDLTPPAGLKAREAISLLLQYAREVDGKTAKPTKQERASFASVVDFLDRSYGDGFASRVIAAINEMPNGSRSLHYTR
jgi:hypothetical protein